MAKISLANLLGGSIAQINNNFNLIKNALNNKVLWRDNPTGEANQMQTGLDMNTNRILNLPYPESPLEPLRKMDVVGAIEIGEAVAAAVAAGSSASAASSSAQLAYASANNANTIANAATASAIAANATATAASQAALAVNALLIKKLPDVHDFGAKGDDVHDDTYAFQLTANTCKNFSIPAGLYKITAPIQLQSGAKVTGAGMLQVRIRRYGVWLGPTFRIGKQDGSEQAQDCEMSGMLIEQLHPGYTLGVSTTMVDRLLDEQSHIDVFGGYNAKFQDIWFEAGVYGISLWGCVLTRLTKIRSYGSWDTLNTAVCENKAVIRLASDSTVAGRAFCTETYIQDCYIGTGAPSPVQTITVGNTSFQGTYNVGPACAVLVNACEGLYIDGGYMGGCAVDCVQFIPQNLCTMIRMDGVFMDESYKANIRFYAGTTPVVGVDIGPNMLFNGQLRTRNAILADDNNGQPTVIGLNIHGGHYDNFMESPFVFNNARAVIVNGPMVGAYNCRNSTANNAAIYSGAFVSNKCTEMHFSNGLYGGGINNWSADNSCKWGVYFEGGAASGTASGVRAILGVTGGSVVGGLTQTYPT